MSADAAASAGSAESESVVSAFLEAMEEAETPFPPKNVPALRKGIQEALETYDAGLVLVGLGWWMAEGFHSPRQISEMVFKAMTQGGRPAPGQTAAALVAEGQCRYAERASKPDATQQRRAASLRAIQEYGGGAG